MSKTRKFSRRNDDLTARALSDFDKLHKCSYNIGGIPSEVCNDLINIIESNNIQGLTDTQNNNISIARYLEDPCILIESTNSFNCGIWFSLSWFFTIVQKSPNLAISYLELLFDKKNRSILYVLEIQDWDKIEMYEQMLEEEILDFNKEDLRKYLKAKKFNLMIYNIINEMDHLQLKDFSRQEVLNFRHEYHEAADMILLVDDYLNTNRTALKSMMKCKDIKLESIKHLCSFEERTESQGHPYCLLGICFENSDAGNMRYPCFDLFEDIDSKLMEEGYDFNMSSHFLYMKNGYKKTLRDFSNLIQNTNEMYSKIHTFLKIHDEKFIYDKLCTIRKQTFQKALSLFTDQVILKQHQLYIQKKESLSPVPLLQ